jgi:4-hydroxythreonine-4-phosphate dehydrogenase
MNLSVADFAGRPIAITMGDAAGIGPEIVVKLFADPAFETPAIVIGDGGMLRRALDTLNLPLNLREIDRPGEAHCERGTIDFISGSDLPLDLPLGQIDARAGAAAYGYIRLGSELAMTGAVAALTTAPINKEALRAAGIQNPSHTEILAELTDTKDYAMMLFNEQLRVVLVTVHLSLLEAIRALSLEAELKAIRWAHRAAKLLGNEKPRVAVAGLNPHAGENGLFGREDLEIIAPAVKTARAEGICVSGPLPGDTVFMMARQGNFDIVVAQYHDQGLIPIKYLGIDGGVNVTLGLPFVRTSVDHGTAYDIAGTGLAEHASLRIAVEQAAAMAAAKLEVVT